MNLPLLVLALRAGVVPSDTLTLPERAEAISRVARERPASIPDSAAVDACSIRRAFPPGFDFRELLHPEAAKLVGPTSTCGDPAALPGRHWHLHGIELVGERRIRVTIRVDAAGESHDEDYLMRAGGPVYEIRIYNWVYDR